MNKKPINWHSPGIVSAIILTIGTVFVAYINGCFTSKTQSKLTNGSGNIQMPTTTLHNVSGNIQMPITTFNNASAVTINVLTPDSATKDAIQALESKISNADDKIEFTKKEINLLSKALKDLDERTSGIKKLPDGRTQFGSLISGEPHIMAQEFLKGVELYNSGDFTSSLKHAQNAIKVYEDSRLIEGSIKIGDINPEFIMKTYFLGALDAHRLTKKELASEYAKKSVEIQPIAANNALLAITLLNIDKIQEASNYIEAALKIEPNNVDYINYKKIIQKREQEVGKTTGVKPQN